MLKKVKKAIDKYLEELAKENQKTFGTRKMDCCNLNREDNKTK